mgnify:CR=1 FL=1
MAIGKWSGRQLETLWMVLQDGMPILRGRSKSEAEAYAKRLGDGLPQKAAGTRIHSPHIELCYDEAAMTTRDNLYTEFRGYRRG